MRCIVCKARAIHRHHCVYAQHLRREAGQDGALFRKWFKDERGLVPMCGPCHGKHHNRIAPVSVTLLPDSVFEFAAEVLGRPAAYEYLSRRYANSDSRLRALISDTWTPVELAIRDEQDELHAA